MMLIDRPHLGKIFILPSEAALIARALERHGMALGETNQEHEELLCDALACAFAALACAMEFEFYLTETDKKAALAAIGQTKKESAS